MNQYKHLILFIGIIFIFIAGCSNRIEDTGNQIIVQKRIGEENQYEQLKEINDKETVNEVKDVLGSINWDNAKVEMAYPPDYKIYLKDSNDQSEPSKYIYHLWISPDQAELVVEGESKHVLLKKDKSSQILWIITDSR